ncbi:Na+/H+ antiporter NhaC family protein [Natronorubrum aibiense]|uniref:Na+/H+ antiporter NhaC family protein n=1 Tax=Natronorubrum aibiense TaxID=348826 RepID=A0A5P9P957_9EURY|nr:Na+/H+ antiporter NhaC family protein [Natronorubrum aibiense]QFU84527.1 Na+/H+ antiporter NhaC family protein [Natronorubrum aibiense]
MPAETYGVWSLVPLLLAIGLALITRKAALALFIGVWSGGVIHRYHDSIELIESSLGGFDIPGSGLLSQLLGVFLAGIWGLTDSLQWITESAGDSVFNMQIIIFCLLLGSAIAMIWKLGGTHAAANWATNYISTKRKAGLVAWGLGLMMFFDDYANSAIVGTTMKDISDNLRMSREKLCYIVDSTAAPVSTIALSSWVAFQMSMIDAGYQATDIAESDVPSSFIIFVQSIPFNMYSILAICMVGIIVVTGWDYGAMLTAEHRAATTGKVNRDDAEPLQDIEGEFGDPIAKDPPLRVFVVPVAVLVSVMIVGALRTGYSEGAGLYDMILEADYAAALVVAAFAMVATTFYYAHKYDLQSVGESVDTTINGFNMMMTALTVLVLAWSIGEVVAVLGTGEFVAAYANEFLTPEIVPIVVLVLATFMGFTMGDSWAVMSILTPIAVPVAWSLTGDHVMVSVIVGAVFSGAIFGDHTSPISPTTVLSATFTGADLIDHVRTQVYYAIPVVVVSAILLLVWGYGSPIWGRSVSAAIVLLPIGVAVLTLLTYGLSQYDTKRKNVDLSEVRLTHSTRAVRSDGDGRPEGEHSE